MRIGRWVELWSLSKTNVCISFTTSRNGLIFSGRSTVDSLDSVERHALRAAAGEQRVKRRAKSRSLCLQVDIKAAQEAIRQGVEVCQRYRRRTSAVYRMLIRPDYNTYTIEELHAELCYAECLLENAILTFVEDQSLVTFIKGGLKIRSCYQSYK